MKKKQVTVYAIRQSSPYYTRTYKYEYTSIRVVVLVVFYTVCQNVTYVYKHGL